MLRQHASSNLPIHEFFPKCFSDIASSESIAKYKTLIYFTGSASAEVIADVALCPMEAFKVRVQIQPGLKLKVWQMWSPSLLRPRMLVGTNAIINLVSPAPVSLWHQFFLFFVFWGGGGGGG